MKKLMTGLLGLALTCPMLSHANVIVIPVHVPVHAAGYFYGFKSQAYGQNSGKGVCKDLGYNGYLPGSMVENISARYKNRTIFLDDNGNLIGLDEKRAGRSILSITCTHDNSKMYE